MVAVNQKGVALSRRERAERTRTRILDAALSLFSSQGYEATTMQQVAEAANVAIQTVYLNFRTKARLLYEVENRLVLGDEPSDRWRDQPWAKSLREERDPRRLLELFVEVDTDIKSRIGPFVAAVGAAIATDSASTAAWERGRDEFFGTLADRLVELGALRADLTANRALDIVRAVNTTEAYIDLTMRRGWTAAEWSAWLLALLAQQLLPSPGG